MFCIFSWEISSDKLFEMKLPLSITIISWFFIAAGITGIVYHAREFNIHDPFARDLLLALFIRLLAIVGGIAALRGKEWGRWLMFTWIGYHVVLSFFHTWDQTAIHGVLFIITAYVLFRPKASAYFKGLPK
ncbi:MAG: hypothetical protein PHP42_14215 [Bacteroidota bacterium]|nr:hypothetical protein [Bacteroidota bacterium]